MKNEILNVDRRQFLRVSATLSGGMVLGFNLAAKGAEGAELAAENTLNAYIKISADNVITIFAPNPESGQNVKTSLPMLVAEELECDWNKLVVEQAGLDSVKYTRQVAGGSGSIPSSWKPFRTAGATAREMLIKAAAKRWNVDASTCKASMGKVEHAASKRSSTYGELAAEAATLEVPKDVKLKEAKDFKIIGKSLTNVDTRKIITGKAEFGMDFRRPGMLFAVVARPPAFGKKIKSVDDSRAKKKPGVQQVIQFGDKVAVLATSTWAALQGREALRIEYTDDGKLESTADHNQRMKEMLGKTVEKPQRKDGDINPAFASAAKVLEMTFECPFLPHAPMEPMNFFAHVTADKAELIGPTQNPTPARKQVSDLLGIPESNISVMMTRMGGGFGRRLNADFVREAAEISKLAKAPVQVVWTREDDMTGGIYRPACQYTYRAALDAQGKITAFHLRGVGLNVGNPTREHNFPAGAVANYLAEGHNLESKVTTGPWRAPVHNFLAFAEQSFLDEIANATGKDPVKLRLELLEQAKAAPVGDVRYNVDRFKATVELAAQKANWGKAPSGIFQGFSSYFSFNTYVAQVVEIKMEDGQPKIHRVVCAVDCGVVINPKAAFNQIEGGIVDGIGHAMYGNLSFTDGAPEQSNFDSYRLIKMADTPKVEVYFVENGLDPTGLGEPTLPPVSAAFGNAVFKATGTRLKKQPFVIEGKKIIG